MESTPRPSLRNLRIFRMVAHLRSVRKAAESVHRSQPAVTQAIGKLEAQVGAILFERRNSGTYLSAAGEIFATRIGFMFRQIEEALESFGLSSGKQSAAADRMTWSQIRALAATADGCSLAAAAKRIGVSQASLHRPARELERNLGKVLFHHSSQGLVATRSGAELARRLALAARELEWGIEEVEAAKGSLAGRLKVGAMPLAGSFLMGPVLEELTRLWPQVHVQVASGSTDYLANALRLGEIDFLVGLLKGSTESADFVQEALVSSTYAVVARKNHPLAEKRKITTADLERYDWIAPGDRATRRAAFDRLMTSMRLRRRANIETYSLSTIRQLLTGGDRLALMTRFEFEFERASGAIVALPYEPLEPMLSIGVTRRANWTPTPLHLKFMEVIRRHSVALGLDGIEHGHAA